MYFRGIFVLVLLVSNLLRKLNLLIPNRNIMYFFIKVIYFRQSLANYIFNYLLVIII